MRTARRRKFQGISWGVFTQSIVGEFPHLFPSKGLIIGSKLARIAVPETRLSQPTKRDGKAGGIVMNAR